MDDRTRRELRKVALSDAASGRAQLAKVTALRTLAKVDRDTGIEIPVDDDGRFNPMPPEWWPLDRHDSDEKRERWKANWLREHGRGRRPPGEAGRGRGDAAEGRGSP